VYRYRAYVDENMDALIQRVADRDPSLSASVELGLNHEQQHQELILTDIKHAFALNPIAPAFGEHPPMRGRAPDLKWLTFPEGLKSIGHTGDRFAFDNESPRHRVYLQGFQLANRPTTTEEYVAFIDDGGYERAELWLSDGWAARTAQQWTAPLYWAKENGVWSAFTLAGRRQLEPTEPVCHLSYYEGDAFARWAGARLPTEAEWETAAANMGLGGHYLESKNYHPAAAVADDDRSPLVKLYGDIWQWTASPYGPYPGYAPAAGALGEYNAKFMCNQLVLRGASCATPRSHARPTYRNFFPPDARWQFTGIRLAKDLT
jgi:ergothioneine biosynthesis protein EgtB